jgi:hypothetical protein
VPGHLPGDVASQARVPVVLDRLRTVAAAAPRRRTAGKGRRRGPPAEVTIGFSTRPSRARIVPASASDHVHSGRLASTHRIDETAETRRNRNNDARLHVPWVRTHDPKVAGSTPELSVCRERRRPRVASCCAVYHKGVQRRLHSSSGPPGYQRLDWIESQE